MKKLLTSAILAASLLSAPSKEAQATPPLRVVHTPQMQQHLNQQYEQRRHEQRIRASYGNEPVRYNYQRIQPHIQNYYPHSFNNPTFFNPQPYNPYYRQQFNTRPFNAPHCIPHRHNQQRPQVIIQFNF